MRYSAKKCFPSPRGEGRGHAPRGEGLLPYLLRNCINRFPHLSHKLLWVIQDHAIRNAKQTYAEGSQQIFFCGVFTQLIGLRVHSTIEFDGHSMFEAVEVENVIFQRELAAEFCSQPSAGKLRPSAFFGFSGVVSQLANSVSGNSHAGIITGRGK